MAYLQLTLKVWRQKSSSNKGKFDYYLEKEYLNLTESTLKKFEKDSSYNLSI